MATPMTPATPEAHLSSTTIIAIIVTVGVVILGLLSGLTWLLIRAIRRHKQLLADLDERGLNIAQAQGRVNRDSIERPRAVLRRNTMLPFNAKSGWGTLQSMETIGSADPAAPSHYAPPKSTGTKEKNRLSWPFHSRKPGSIEMKSMKDKRLSTVIEDPKPSSKVPILESDQLSKARPPLSMSKEGEGCRSPSQSLLQYHPAFRNDRPSAAEAAKSRQRSRSATDLVHNERPQVRARSASLCSQLSNKAPDIILPPLPLDIARMKDEARNHELRQAPSLLSISSVGSVNSSILNLRPSPVNVITQSNRPNKVTKRIWNNPAVSNDNSGRASRERRQSTHSSQGWTNAARLSTDSSHSSRNSKVPKELKTQNVAPESVVYHENARVWTSLRRSARPPVVGESPDWQRQGSIHSRNRVPVRSPKRQSSRMSTRSSFGNPFQWDPTPIAPTGKPSALKGSPGARQGHKRKTSVRISLVPTVHPIQSRIASLVSGEDKENTGDVTTKSNLWTFVDETPALRATLTSTSSELPSLLYDQDDASIYHRDDKRLSVGSLVSLSSFPMPSPLSDSYDTEGAQNALPIDPLDFDVKLPMPETPLLAQYPFRDGTPERRLSPSPPPIDIDAYDPEQPTLGFATPSNNSTRVFQSAFATIPEEGPISLQKTLDFSTSPVSPIASLMNQSGSPSVFNLFTTLEEEPQPQPQTINPTLIPIDTLSTLNSPPSPPIPSSPRPAHSTLPSIDKQPSTNANANPTLRSSIQALRRMNSEALNAGHARESRGERRYLRLGRRESAGFGAGFTALDDASDAESTFGGAEAPWMADVGKGRKDSKVGYEEEDGEGERGGEEMLQERSQPGERERDWGDAAMMPVPVEDADLFWSSLPAQNNNYNNAQPSPMYPIYSPYAPPLFTNTHYPARPSSAYTDDEVLSEAAFPGFPSPCPTAHASRDFSFVETSGNGWGVTSSAGSPVRKARRSGRMSGVGHGGGSMRDSGASTIRGSVVKHDGGGGMRGEEEEEVRIHVTTPKGTMAAVGVPGSGSRNWYDDDGFLQS